MFRARGVAASWNDNVARQPVIRTVGTSRGIIKLHPVVAVTSSTVTPAAISRSAIRSFRVRTGARCGSREGWLGPGDASLSARRRARGAVLAQGVGLVLGIRLTSGSLPAVPSG